jgi:hypothetical protein
VDRESHPELDRLLAANPLAQFPTLITPEGAVLTEMVAIAFCKYVLIRDFHESVHILTLV